MKYVLFVCNHNAGRSQWRTRSSSVHAAGYRPIGGL